jgi:hypothetical protein
MVCTVRELRIQAGWMARVSGRNPAPGYGVT